jgi:hypothetical protein
MPINFNINPYYDDFDADKGFLRILFRPGYAVQARELTQLQTILQEQVGQFGAGIYKNGSIVYGANSTVDEKAQYIVLESEYDNAEITDTLASLVGKTIVTKNNPIIALDGFQSSRYVVLGYQAATDTTPPLVYVNLIAGEGVVGTEDFYDDSDNAQTSIMRVADATGTALKGKATFVNLNEGVFYVNNYFVHSPSQSIVIADEYNNNYPANCRVGLQISNVIVDEDDDVTLLDPAEGSYNYTAPGGHRYTIQLDLQRKNTFGIDETDDDVILEGSADIDFIEIFRFLSGQLIRTVKYPVYSAIGDEMARRTFDINGNFTTEAFMIQADEHILGEDDKLTLSLEQGRAFVQGRVFETTGIFKENLNKAREYGVSLSNNVGVGFGNYVITNRHFGLFDIDDQPTVDLVNIQLEEKSAFLTIDHVAGNPWTVVNSDYSEVAKGMLVKITFAGGTKWAVIDNWVDHATDTRTYYLRKTTPANATYPGTLQQWGSTEESDTNNTVEIFDPTGQDQIFIYSGTNNNTTVGVIPQSAYENGFKIGTARVRLTRFAEKDITDFGLGNGSELDIKHRTYLFDISVVRDTFQNLEEIAIASLSGGAYSYTKSAAIAVDGKTGEEENGTTILFDAAFNNLLFRLPYDNIRSIRTDGLLSSEGGTSDLDYSYQKYYSNISVPNAGAGGRESAPIISPDSSNLFYPSAGTIPGSTAQLFYTMIIRAGGFVDVNGQQYTAGDVVDLGPTSGVILSIDLGRPVDSTDTLRVEFPAPGNGGAVAPSTGTTFDLIATINVNNGAEKSKTLTGKNLNFESPNQIGGNRDNLYTSDIFDIIGIWDSGDTGTAIVINDYTIASNGDLLDGDGNVAFENIASRYELNNGQKDNYYDYGSLKLGVGSPAPSGQLAIRFRYFQHLTAGNTGAFTVNSYTDVSYADIPEFISPSTGTKVQLRDVIDFRGRRRDASITGNNITAGDASVTTYDELEGVVLPLPSTTVDVDFSYYLSRKDRLVITSGLELQVIEGVSSLTPLSPQIPADSLLLYDIDVPAYTFRPSDVAFKYRPVSNYTMANIATLEQRIADLEYITNLNALEKEAESLILTNPDGTVSLKTGILVDGFAGHQIGDVSNADYDIAIDPDQGEMRPPFVQTYAEMQFVESQSKNVRRTGELITLPYTEQILVSQPLASKAINVNPYNVTNFLGTIELSPERDDWVEIEQRPTLNVNLEGENDNWRADTVLLNEALRRWRDENARRLIGEGTQWNSWETTWAGRETSTSTSVETNRSRTRNGAVITDRTTTEQVTRSTTTLTERQTRTGTRTRVGLTTVTRSLGNRVVNLSITPWIRSKEVLFVAKGMRPNTTVHAFFDDVNVDAHVKPANGIQLVGVGLQYSAGARADEQVFLDKERVNVYDVSDPNTILGHGFVVSGNDGTSGNLLLTNLTSETTFSTRLVKRTLRQTATATNKWSGTIGRRHNNRVIEKINISNLLGNDANGNKIVANTLRITGIRVRGDLNASSEYITVRFPDQSVTWDSLMWRNDPHWTWSATRFLAGQFSGVRADGIFRDDTNFTSRNVSAGIYEDNGDQYVDVWLQPTSAVNYAPGTLRSGSQNWWEIQFEFEAEYEVLRTVDDIITEQNPGTQAQIDTIINDNSRVLEIVGTETTYVDPVTGNTLLRTPPSARITGSTESTYGQTLTTNNAGVVTGTFRIPNEGENGLRFRTGERKFLLHDNPNTSNLSASTTSADASYFAQGQKKVMQEQTVSTRVIGLIRESVTETRTVRSVVDRSESRQVLSQNTVTWVDPVAQTFLIDGTIYPNGLFITSLDLFFKSKDRSLPVTVQIRPTVNGYPDNSAVIPFSNVELQPSQVVIPSNAFDNTTILQSPTNARFSSPVYLAPGEYCVVILSNSNNYELYVSEMGEEILGSSQRISEQPYAGSLFKSQNASTWTAEQLEDLMFKLNRAEFDIGSASEVILGQYQLSDEKPYQAFMTQINVLDNMDPVSVGAYYKATSKSESDITDDAELALDTGYIPFKPGATVYTDRERIVGPEAGTFYLKYELRSTDPTVSPIVDIVPSSIIFIDQQINNADISGDDIIVQTIGTGWDPVNPPTTDDGRIVVTGTGTGAVIEALVATGDEDNYNAGDLYGFNVISGGSGYVETPSISINPEGAEVPPTLVIVGETNNVGGNSIARYVTRRVTLPDERLYSDNMLVTLNSIKPRGSRVEVYYKVLSQSDPSDFDELEYIRMELQGEEQFSSNIDDEVVMNFKPVNNSGIQYTNSEGTVFDNFITYSIKICLFSQSKVDVPIIRDMKVVTGQI